jgi:hypothetical protein
MNPPKDNLPLATILVSAFLVAAVGGAPAADEAAQEAELAKKLLFPK